MEQCAPSSRPWSADLVPNKPGMGGALSAPTVRAAAQPSKFAAKVADPNFT